jgi:hypothetical protein
MAMFPSVIETCIIEYVCSPLELAKSATSLRALKRHVSEGLIIGDIAHSIVRHFIQKMDIEIVKHLIDTEYIMIDGMMMHSALQTGSAEMTILLATKVGYEMFDKVLDAAMHDMPIDLLRSLIDHNYLPDVSTDETNVYDILSAIVTYERLDALEYIIDRYEPQFDMYMVMAAITAGNVEIYRKLISFDILSNNMQYRDVLFNLVSSGHYAMLRELIESNQYRHDIPYTIDVIMRSDDVDLVALRILQEYV